jgi:hypothetical protein
MNLMKRNGPKVIPGSDPQQSVQDKQDKHDRHVAALYEELRGLELRGLTDRIDEVHAELERLGVGIRRDK